MDTDKNAEVVCACCGCGETVTGKLSSWAAGQTIVSSWYVFFKSWWGAKDK
jgi:hypothetical protein